MAGSGIPGIEISDRQFADTLEFYGASQRVIKAELSIYSELNLLSISKGNKIISEKELTSYYDNAWRKLETKDIQVLVKMGGGKLSQLFKRSEEITGLEIICI